MSTPRKAAGRRPAPGAREARALDVASDVANDGTSGDGVSGDGTSGTALDAVHDTYRLLDDHFDDVYGACQTDAQRAELRALHASARDAYWKAVADGLHDNNQIVQDIRRDLAAATARIEQQLTTLQDVTAVLQAMTEAVRLSGALVGLAAG